MEAGTRQIVASLKDRLTGLRDLPKVVLALWQFGLSDEQRELAKQALRTYLLSQIVGGAKKKRDQEEIDRILNTKPYA